MENKRVLKVLYGKTGTGHINTRITIPKTILEDMGIDEEKREVLFIYDKEKKEIIIKKLV